MSTVFARSVTRFDLILLVIGVALGASVGIGWLSSLPVEAAIAGGTVVAAAAMIDGLVVHPPGQ